MLSLKKQKKMNSTLYKTASIFIAVIIAIGCTNNKPEQPQLKEQPKLVVGIVVDQMKYEYLEKYASQYSEKGFARFVKEGYGFTNCNYSYIPTYTGPGHATIFTGMLPIKSGIIANDWFDPDSNRSIYCVEDYSVRPVGTNAIKESRSPRNLKVNSISDYILKSNPNGKTLSVSLKDRGAVLPGGQKSKIVFWMDDYGQFVSSNHYMNTLPSWVQHFNSDSIAFAYRDSIWRTLLPLEDYQISFPDYHPFEVAIFNDSAIFPKKLSGGMNRLGTGAIKGTPYGNTILRQFAQKAIVENRLGMDEAIDFVSISFSSADYIGHNYGPNSIEVHDNYLRLDLEIAELLEFLNQHVGNGEYLVYLTADHGVAALPDPEKGKKAYFSSFSTDSALQAFQFKTWGHNFILKRTNFQIYLDHEKIKSSGIELNDVTQDLVEFLYQIEGVKEVFNLRDTNKEKSFVMMQNGGFNGDIAYTLDYGLMERGSGSTHGSGYNYDTHVPFLLLGKNVPNNRSIHPINVVDITPTVLNLISIEHPPLDGEARELN